MKIVRTAETPATERGEETRRRILEDAALAFAENGYVGTSLNDVIRRSALTKGAFYFHFASKEELALEVFRSKQEAWYGKVMTASSGHERALDQAKAMLAAIVRIHLTDPSARAVSRLCWELSEDEKLAPQMKPFLTTWFTVLETILLKAQEEGDIGATVDCEKLSFFAASAFIGIEDVSYLLNHNAELERRANDLLDIVLKVAEAKE